MNLKSHLWIPNLCFLRVSAITHFKTLASRSLREAQVLLSSISCLCLEHVHKPNSCKRVQHETHYTYSTLIDCRMRKLEETTHTCVLVHYKYNFLSDFYFYISFIFTSLASMLFIFLWFCCSLGLILYQFPR